MKEIWKDILDYEGIYMISNLGRVKSLKRIVNSKSGGRTVNERIISQKTNKLGYKSCTLRVYNTDKTCLVHRLVAQAFIPNPGNKPQVNHIDGDKGNNKVDNLEWSTAKENCNHAFQNGLKSKEVLIEIGRKASVNSKKKIAQYDKEMKIISTFDSCQEASDSTKIPLPNISEVCHNKRKTAGGYIWRYI